MLWTSVLGTLALVVGGLVWIASGAFREPVYVPGVNEITSDDHVYGKSDATVTFVEYADYECPACAQYYPFIKRLKNEYGDRARFVYRNFPIPGHANGIPAARAAEAAALQGKFEEMEGELFTRQSEWAPLDAGSLQKTLDSYAQALGLDMNKFRADMASDAVLAKIDRDAQSGIKAGVDSTPTFFLNGIVIRASSYEQFAGKFDEALAE